MRTELTDGPITIRKYRTGDADGLYRAVALSMVELSMWTAWAQPGYCMNDTREWIFRSIKNWDDEFEFHFLIEKCGGEEIIGGCGLNNIDTENGRLNLGYWVRSDRTGQGVATSAALLAARFAMIDCGMSRIEICMDISNISSMRVAEKTGAIREGILRNRLRVNGALHDAYLYSIIPGDILNFHFWSVAS